MILPAEHLFSTASGIVAACCTPGQGHRTRAHVNLPDRIVAGLACVGLCCLLRCSHGVRGVGGCSERKNVNLPGVVVDLPTLTAKDEEDLVQWGLPNDIDFIAASFVRKGSDLDYIRKVGPLPTLAQHARAACTGKSTRVYNNPASYFLCLQNALIQEVLL